MCWRGADSLAEPMRSFHRAEFLRILERHIPSTYRTHFSKRLTSYDEHAQGPVVLRFRDGTTAKCDILVGADGIKSAVRKIMFTKLATKEQDKDRAATYRRCVDATWSGVVTYRALIPTDTFRAEYPDHPALSFPVFVCDFLLVCGSR